MDKEKGTWPDGPRASSSTYNYEDVLPVVTTERIMQLWDDSIDAAGSNIPRFASMLIAEARKNTAVADVRQNLSYLDLPALRQGAIAALPTAARKTAQDLIAVIDAIKPIYPKQFLFKG